MHSKSTGLVKQIAQERIGILYSLAKKEPDPGLMRDYTKLIRKIAAHYRIPLSKEMGSHICRKCGSMLALGKNLSVRKLSGKRMMLYKCLDCGNERQIPY